MLINLEIKLEHASCEWCIENVKCHKIGTNDKIKGKQAIEKVTFLFLEHGMHGVR